MESQKFEELEAVEQVESDIPAEKPELKEYEKLLLAEANRAAYERAVNLIKYGCFDQKEVPSIDFSKYTRLDKEKKYKGLYSLYQNIDTLELVFICPLVENNKGDDKEERNMAPYAYDCIFIEKMDDEEYQMVVHAAKNNIRSLVSVLVTITWVVYALLVVLVLVSTISLIISLADGGGNFVNIIYNLLSATGAIDAGVVIALPLLVLMSIKYKSYKEQ